MNGASDFPALQLDVVQAQCEEKNDSNRENHDPSSPESTSSLEESIRLNEKFIFKLTIAEFYQRRFERDGGETDLEKAINSTQKAIEIVPDSHQHKHVALGNFGSILHERFQRKGDPNDLERAVNAIQRAVDLTLDGHVDKSAHLNNLGVSLRDRFNHLGEVADLDTAVSLSEMAVNLIVDEDAKKAIYLYNLAASLEIRFTQSSIFDDLEKAIVAMRNAVKFSESASQAEKAGYLSGLGRCLRERFVQLNTPSDIEEAIHVLQTAVDQTPDGHREKAKRLLNLGNALYFWSEHLDSYKELERLISVLEEAADLFSQSNADKAGVCGCLGNSYQLRFVHLGNIEDLNKSILCKQTAIDLIPENHAFKAILYTNLGSALHSRFEQLGDPSDLEKAISTQKDALACTPSTHADIGGHYHNLGTVLQRRFELFGMLATADLDEVISVKQRALELTPKGHLKKASRLQSLGNALQIRFEHTGSLTDLEKALFLLHLAVGSVADDSMEKATYLNNLGNSLLRRFQYCGEESDLDDAVSATQRACNLLPDHHADKAALLHNVGNALYSRFGHLGERADLFKAVSANQRAVQLTPDNHWFKGMYLNSLGNALQSQFEITGNPTDLDDAVRAKDTCVILTPDGYQHKSLYLGSFSVLLGRRFKISRLLDDLEKAVLVAQSAVDLASEKNWKKAGYLDILGSSLMSRFDHFGNISDLNNAILSRKQTVDLTPDGHLHKSLYLSNLGWSYHMRFNQNRNKADLEHASNFYQQSCFDPSGKPTIRFVAAFLWAGICELRGQTSLALVAYEKVFSLIQEVIWLGQSIYQKLEGVFNKLSHTTATAVMVAISCGELSKALEWLEEGRSIVWGQTTKLRTPFDELSAVNPELAAKLKTTVLALEAAQISTSTSTSTSSDPGATVQKNRALSLEYNDLLMQARTLDGFANFLQPKKLVDLIAAAEHGPVVTINMHQTRCDALILDCSGVISHVHLKDFSYNEAETMRTTMSSYMRSRGLGRSRGQRQADPRAEEIVFYLLKHLRTKVVEPVLQKIHNLPCNPPNKLLPQVTWCPTGPLVFLPLHAASIIEFESLSHSSNNRKCGTFVSSYTTSLSALLPRPTSKQISSMPLAISHSPNANPIPGAKDEIETMKKCFDQLYWLNQDQATVSKVLTAIEKHSMVHFACHGVQDADKPTKSAFILFDEKLTLEDLMRKDLKNIDLAMLSACQTATGDGKLPDEAVHLAASMLSAGARSVVGTIWPIKDEDAPVVAEAFYSKLMQYREEAERDWGSKTAHALHYAVEHLRMKVGEKEYHRWLPFVHYGTAPRLGQ